MLQAQTQHLFSHQHDLSPCCFPPGRQHQASTPLPPTCRTSTGSTGARSLSSATQPQQLQQQQQQQQHPHYNRLALIGATSANNPQSAQGGPDSTALGAAANMDSMISEENRKVLVWVAELLDPSRRETALMELSKKREQVPELALIIWHSFGVMTSLLQEIISVYPLLNPSQLTAAASNRVCNALALLQCVASHNETRTLFLNAHIPLFLYPFLNTTSKSRPFGIPSPHIPGCDRCSGEK
ncbi:cell differentiation protein rcd1 [Coccidioides immitis H538.4]|uniref:Cell differentiation protein rcd1 n=1 Tax=Coccidioides immitis H538.4 TaxID=396776 RepID=A0A0J8RPM7_COCIT|nr:cell differentiation protein rcd1 [Coccidioides immitis H538.4]